MKKIKVGVVVDSMGGFDLTPQEEIEEIMVFFAMFDIPVTLAVGGEHMGVIERKSIDLLIIDYGGLMASAFGVQVSQIRAACEWAENNPGKLMIIWSNHTREIYIDELLEHFGNLDNIRFRFKKRYGCEVDRELFDELKTWYGIGE